MKFLNVAHCAVCKAGATDGVGVEMAGMCPCKDS